MMQPLVDRGLLLEFFLTFAQFEYALKASGLCVRHREDPLDLPAATPDWDSFAASLRPTFLAERTPELLEACQYLLDHPPNKQVLLGGGPAWQTPVRGAHVTDVEFLLLMIRCVRNNLFHGGKHGLSPHESRERTEKLLRSSLAILHECLALSPRQREAYATAEL
jgi:hypothetical protein